MKKVWHIAFAAVAALLAVGCEDDVDFFTRQQDSIVRYLTSSRRLIAEEERGDVIEENPAFYTSFERMTYRHIPTYYDEGRDALPQVDMGKKLELTFDAFVFSGSEPQLSACYWSNSTKTIEALKTAGNDFADLEWSTEPLVVTLGETPLIAGLERGLVGCREKDSVQIYMTYKTAYGKELLGTVPKQSPVAWYVKILSVK